MSGETFQLYRILFIPYVVTPSSSTSRLKTTTSAGVKKVTAASKVALDEKKKVSTSSSQSPILAKKVISASKKVPTSSPSLRHKALHKEVPKESKTNVAERRKRLLPQHPTMTPSSTKKISGSAQKLQVGKKGEVSRSGAKGHEKVAKPKPGTTETHRGKPISSIEDEKTVHVASHQVESDYSLTSVGSGASNVDSESSWLQWTVIISLIAKNTEQIFGITIPNVAICGDNECELLETIAMRVHKWKMLGRYLGVDDDSLDEIEMQNHFVGERCLKMLKKFQTVSDDEATYVRLATALKNIMQDSLISDISQFFPKDQDSESSPGSYTIKPTVKLDEMHACLSVIREDFKLQKNNGKNKATVLVHATSYSQTVSAPPQTNPPVGFKLTSLDVDSVRVIEDVCIAAAVRKIKQLSITINYE